MADSIRRKIVLGRRRVLGLLAAAPLAARGAAEESAMRLTQMIRPQGLGFIRGAEGGPASGPMPAVTAAERRFALQWPSLRQQIESELYQANRVVHSIDHDLASKRSFSLAAKVAFQRQRNVQRALDEFRKDEPHVWERMNSLFLKARSLFS
jgi:hypothetical protein